MCQTRVALRRPSTYAVPCSRLVVPRTRRHCVPCPISTNYSFGTTAAQWIENSDLDGDGTMDHVYGTLKRDVLDVTGRVTYAFTRDLTLQVFLPNRSMIDLASVGSRRMSG